MYPHERSLVNSLTSRPFSLLGVNTDDSISTAKTAIKENDLNWRSWYDGQGGPIVKKFGIESFPTIFVVDHTGVIRYKGLRGKKLELAINTLVAEAEASGAGSTPAGEIVQREFTDSTGDFKVTATYVGMDGDGVKLKKDDGSEIVVPLSRLSESDQEYVRKNGK